ncbi:reverse transcriptase, partial [Sinorhizobium medicae]|nr:reverse transcriptase [Sinorhizobium medicae]
GKPGQFRPLGIPTIRDRVVQGAAKINWIVEAAWCARFSETQTTGEPMPLRAAGP